MLSKLYFAPVGTFTPVDSRHSYNVVHVNDGAMVLTDPLVGPVCSVHFTPGFISARGSKPGFIGVTSTDGARVQLVLTNLQSTGEIFVDICKSHKGGPAVNAINVLRPRQSVTVDSDASAGEREMLLSAMGADSVQQDEAKAAATGAPAKGTYLHVTVTPELGGDLRRAQWSCPDYVVFEQNPRTVSSSTSYNGIYQQHQMQGSASVLRSPGSPCYSSGGLESYQPSHMIQYEAELAQGCSMTLPDDEDGDLGSDSWASVPKVAKASKLEHGDVKQAGGRAIQKDFAWKQSSPSTELCLSVLVGDTIQRRAQALDVGAALDVLKRYLAGGNQRLLDAIAVVYPEADCCLCLEPGPNVVFAKCGHACAHLACVAPSLIKCPLCRARIFATIKMV